jgi:hypothetical protein
MGNRSAEPVGRFSSPPDYHGFRPICGLEICRLGNALLHKHNWRYENVAKLPISNLLKVYR